MLRSTHRLSPRTWTGPHSSKPSAEQSYQHLGVQSVRAGRRVRREPCLLTQRGAGASGGCFSLRAAQCLRRACHTPGCHLIKLSRRHGRREERDNAVDALRQASRADCPIALSIGPASDAPASLAPATKACPAAATTQQWARRAALETRRAQCGWAVERFACKLLPARMLTQLLDDVVNACIASCAVNTAVAVS